MKCTNCCVSKSSQWRKLDYKIYCNACCIYYKRWKHHRDTDMYYAQILLSLNKNK